MALSPSSQPFPAAAMIIAYSPGDLVGEGGHREGVFDPLQNVEIGQARLDHDHVGALGDVELDFAQRLVGVRRVHLVGALVADQRGAGADRVAEWAVEGGGVFGRIGHDLDVAKAGGIEAGADGADAAVHHVGGRDDVAAGLGFDQGLADQDRYRFVVEDDAVAESPSWPWLV